MRNRIRRGERTDTGLVGGLTGLLLLLASASPASATFIGSYNVDEPALLGTGMITVEIGGAFGPQAVLDFMGTAPAASDWDDFFVEISDTPGSSGVFLTVEVSAELFTYLIPHTPGAGDTALDVWFAAVASEDTLTEKVPEPTSALLLAGPLAVLGAPCRRRMRR